MTLNKSVKALTELYGQTVKELAATSKQLAVLERRTSELAEQRETLKQAIYELTGRMPDAHTLPETLPLSFPASTKIGDAIETILTFRGPMKAREILDILRQSRVRLSKEHAHVVLANAITRDTQKRFKRLKDGRIALTKDGK